MKYLLLWLPLALAACSSPPTTLPPRAEVATSANVTPPAKQPNLAMTLSQYHWQLNAANDATGKRIAALFVQPEKPLQLDFSENRLSFSNSCNRINASYHLDGDTLQVGQLAQTMMACADPALLALDAAVNQHLSGTLKLAVQTGDGTPQLQLTNANHDMLTFSATPTAQTRYGSTGETVFLEVAAQTKPCSHPPMPTHACLQVREIHYDGNGRRLGTPGEWAPLYTTIDGYQHQAGIRNVLRLKRFTIKNPPADTPSSAYVLDMVVESETVKP